jgi:hypothetical protein
MENPYTKVDGTQLLITDTEHVDVSNPAQAGSVSHATDAPNPTQGGSIFGTGASASNPAQAAFYTTYAPKPTQGGSLFGTGASASNPAQAAFYATYAPSSLLGTGASAPNTAQGGSVSQTDPSHATDAPNPTQGGSNPAEGGSHAGLPDGGGPSTSNHKTAEDQDLPDADEVYEGLNRAHQLNQEQKLEMIEKIIELPSDDEGIFADKLESTIIPPGFQISMKDLCDITEPWDFFESDERHKAKMANRSMSL